MLVYVVRERSESLNEIKRLISTGKVTVLHDRDQLYDHVVRTLADETYSNTGPRRILHAALHGTDRPRVSDTGARSASLRAFDEMMGRCITGHGKHSWAVRTIYTVVDETRLDVIVRRLENQEASDKYEVKVLIVSGYAPVLPLVVGDQHVYLAFDDPRYYRAGSGIYIEGKEAASLAVEYFNRLWEDHRAYFIRRATGVDRDAVNAIRARVNALTGPPQVLQTGSDLMDAIVELMLGGDGRLRCWRCVGAYFRLEEEFPMPGVIWSPYQAFGSRSACRR